MGASNGRTGWAKRPTIGALRACRYGREVEKALRADGNSAEPTASASAAAAIREARGPVGPEISEISNVAPRVSERRSKLKGWCAYGVEVRVGPNFEYKGEIQSLPLSAEADPEERVESAARATGYFGRCRKWADGNSRQIFNELYEDLGAREERLAQLERSIQALGSQHEVVRRLETVPGIGYLSATAMFATVGDAKQYRNGRQLAASIGLVPRQSSSGGKQRLLGITKRGDKYLRKLLVHGARSVATRAAHAPQPQNRWLNDLRERRGKPRSYVAQANKTARIAWVVMAKGEVYKAPTARPETSIAVAA